MIITAIQKGNLLYVYGERNRLYPLKAENFTVIRVVRLRLRTETRFIPITSAERSFLRIARGD